MILEILEEAEKAIATSFLSSTLNEKRKKWKVSLSRRNTREDIQSGTPWP